MRYLVTDQSIKFGGTVNVLLFVEAPYSGGVAFSLPKTVVGHHTGFDVAIGATVQRGLPHGPGPLGVASWERMLTPCPTSSSRP